MRRLQIPGLLFLASVLAAAPGWAQAQDQSPLAIVGGMLVDGHGGPPLHHAVVLIEGDSIKGTVSLGEAGEGTFTGSRKK